MRAKGVHRTEGGFTLIELSIVLVIIGLIVGGVLVGQDLIRAAAVRAQISQIEKYNAAVNTFRGKYNAVPGDMNAATASAFGFGPRGGLPGQGDGNGVIESDAALATCGFCENGGETGMFWVDLSAAQMIDGSFSTATESGVNSTVMTGSGIDLYYPAAKIGGGNYVYVWSGGPQLGWTGSNETNHDGQNYYGLSAITSLPATWQIFSLPGLTVAQAYSMDKKVDDGIPQSGNVIAMYLSGQTSGTWAGTGNGTGAPYTTATQGSPTTCFDNGNGSGAQQYSLQQNGGSGSNCALSFRFQ
jgi:prepilin-type N-terminal cleavage/methylation domain-containing protein